VWRPPSFSGGDRNASGGAEFDAAALELCKQIRVFMDEHIASREAEWRTQARAGAYPLDLVIVLKQPARDQGLLTGGAPRQPRIPLAEARGEFLGRPKYSTAIRLTTVILRSYNAAPPWKGESGGSTRCSTAQSAPVFKGIVLLDMPGLRIVRDVLIMNHHSPERHCEIDFDVPVPVADLLGNEGDSFAVVQAQLGPGRIGQREVALELMIARAKSRFAFSSPQDWVAESRIEIDLARLLVLRAAWLMDKPVNKAAHVDVSAIKFVAGRMQTRGLDRAIQVVGAAGLTEDTPLACLWNWGRALRFIDGPDEVHPRGIARRDERGGRGAAAPLADFRRSRPCRQTRREFK
jgi:hypothetical protein